MSDLSQSEREAMEAAWQQERWLSDTSKDLRTFEAGWRAGVEWSRSPEAVERAAKAVKVHLRAAYYPMPVNQELPPTMKMRLRGDAEKIARAALDATSEKGKRDG